MDHPIKYLPYAAIALLLGYTVYLWLLTHTAKQKENAALKAVHNAFQRAADTKESYLLPCKYYIHWPRLFYTHSLHLRLDAPARFEQLRALWGISEPHYRSEALGEWKPMGDSASGLSGSLFFRSHPNGDLLLKSLNREFEIQFLHQHFLSAYFDFVQSNPKTLINKVLDVLCSFERRIVRTTPYRYLVLENLARDIEDDWDLFDLKPTTYLEPIRDLLPEQLHTSGVTDILPKDKVLLVSSDEREELLKQLRNDTEFLASLGAIDYSVLLVRKPDGTGRVALIDVFWSLRTPRAQLTKQISDAAGVPEQTVTADAEDYGKEIVRMIEKSIRVR